MALYDKARKIITEGNEKACQECKKKGTIHCNIKSCKWLKDWERHERKMEKKGKKS